MNKLKVLYRTSQFKPTFLSYFINPFSIARNELYRAISSAGSHFGGNILDVGCGRKPYQHLFQFESYTGIEYDSEKSRLHSKADVFYSGNSFPLKKDTYNLVLCNQVLEHVFEPDLFLKEINRVMQKDGILILTVPFVWDEHEQPYDYARYTSFGLKYLLSENGYHIETQKKLSPGFRCISQLASGHIYKIFAEKSPYLQLIVTLIILAPINFLGRMMAKLLPLSTKDLYLDNFIIAKKI